MNFKNEFYKKYGYTKEQEEFMSLLDQEVKKEEPKGKKIVLLLLIL